MIQQFDECLKMGLIRPFPRNTGLIERELSIADSDYRTACKSFSEEVYSWSTIQAYYSMFHAARAVLYDAGYREKSHRCIEIFIDKLVDDGRLDSRYYNYFTAARELRENANYDLSYSRDGAATSLKYAKIFLEKMRELIQNAPG